jgi:hypothetical protein
MAAVFRYFCPCLSSIDKGKRKATKWARRSIVHTPETRYFWFGFFFFRVLPAVKDFNKTKTDFLKNRRRCGQGTNSVHVQRLPWTSKAYRLCSKT